MSGKSVLIVRCAGCSTVLRKGLLGGQREKSCYGFISSGIVVRKTEGMRYSRRYTPENATITKDYAKLIRSYIGGLRHIPPVAPIYKS